MTAWSPQQDNALCDVAKWLADYQPGQAQQVFRLFGYAGTGKSTLAKAFAEDVEGRVLYGAFTGKAALVMRQKGCDGASTIHSMIYDTKVDPVTGIHQFKKKPKGAMSNVGLIIIDECSMLGEELARDLLSFDKPVLVLGDPAQLPPVKSAGYFTGAQPDVMLTEVHRQARDNPIIAMSMVIREKQRTLRIGRMGESEVISKEDLNIDLINQFDQFLVGKNKSRHDWNAAIRNEAGKPEHEPIADDRVICLRNDKELGIFNGQMFEVAKVSSSRGGFHMDVVPEDADGNRAATRQVDVYEHFFRGAEDQLDNFQRMEGQQFCFGYAITTHKAQGSQWPSVIITDEGGFMRHDAWRWTYTAVTRAAEKVLVAV